MHHVFQDDLADAFPASTDVAIQLGVHQGVMLANAAVENELFLRTDIGRDLLGHLRRAAVLFRIHELCQSGDLPFDATMTRMPRGGGHWVEIRSGAFKAHICRTDSLKAFPEDTPTRQDQRLTNQGDLFSDNVAWLHPDQAVPGDRYAWLTFGAQGSNLTHLSWGMPAAAKDIWLAQVNILHRLQTEVAKPAPEAPSTKMKLRFREHIEESLKSGDERRRPSE